jgi:hypothetical protein
VSIWILILVVALTWFLNLVASLTQAGVEDIKNPLPPGQTRGVSLMLIPVMAVFFVLVAIGVDVLFNTPWGSRVVVGAHVLFAVACFIGAARDVRYIRRHGSDGD